MDDLTYKKAVLYVMSGTGNTYRVSRWIEDIARQHKVKAQAVMIEDADFSSDLNQTHHFLLGLLFPTHGFMPPWSMIKFLFRIPGRKNTPAMCVATRGALKIGPLQIPGASGIAAFFAATMMLLKGYRVRAVLLYFITTVPVISYVWLWLYDSLNFNPVRSGYWTSEVASIFSFLLYIIYFLSAVFLSYWLFWHLIQFPVFNKFFSATTLTHYYRRYQEPETRLKDMSRNMGKDSTPNTGNPER